MMSIAPLTTPNAAAPLSAPSASTAAAPDIAPGGVSTTGSSLSSAEEPNTISCFSHIVSVIESALSGVLSFLFSLWRWVTCTDSPAEGSVAERIPQPPPVDPILQARIAQESATALVAQGQGLFNALLPEISPDLSHRLALIITIGNEIIAAYTQKLSEVSLPPEVTIEALDEASARIAEVLRARIRSATPPDREAPRKRFFREGMQGLERILRQDPSLNARTVVGIQVIDLKYHAENRNPHAPASYSIFSGGFSAERGDGYSRVEVSDLRELRQSASSTSDPHEMALREEILRFFSNHSAARTGWIYPNRETRSS